MAGQLRIGEAAGPYDINDLATTADELANSHLDLGSVLVPVVEGGQVTVEMSAEHSLEAVYLVTPVGRVSVHAFAAPRSGGLWREVVRELGEGLRAQGATTAVEDGHWGREVVARLEDGEYRFIGVDGPRWMVRCVASGPVGDAEQLAQLSRAVLAETVVRRGDEPFPPRDVLPLVLPPVLAEQVAAAQTQLADAEPGAASELPAEPAGHIDAEHADTESIDPESVGTESAAPAADSPRGALEQLRDATVVHAEPDDTRVDQRDGPAAVLDDDENDGGEHGDDSAGDERDAADDTPPSRGSAMQRFRRRRRR